MRSLFIKLFVALCSGLSVNGESVLLIESDFQRYSSYWDCSGREKTEINDRGAYLLAENLECLNKRLSFQARFGVRPNSLWDRDEVLFSLDFKQINEGASPQKVYKLVLLSSGRDVRNGWGRAQLRFVSDFEGQPIDLGKFSPFSVGMLNLPDRADFSKEFKCTLDFSAQDSKSLLRLCLYSSREDKIPSFASTWIEAPDWLGEEVSLELSSSLDASVNNGDSSSPLLGLEVSKPKLSEVVLDELVTMGKASIKLERAFTVSETEELAKYSITRLGEFTTEKDELIFATREFSLAEEECKGTVICCCWSNTYEDFSRYLSHTNSFGFRDLFDFCQRNSFKLIMSTVPDRYWVPDTNQWELSNAAQERIKDISKGLSTRFFEGLEPLVDESKPVFGVGISAGTQFLHRVYSSGLKPNFFAALHFDLGDSYTLPSEKEKPIPILITHGADTGTLDNSLRFFEELRKNREFENCFFYPIIGSKHAVQPVTAMMRELFFAAILRDDLEEKALGFESIGFYDYALLHLMAADSGYPLPDLYRLPLFSSSCASILERAYVTEEVVIP